MPKLAGPPLTKVTLNLFTADVEWFRQRHGQGYSEIIRAVVNKHVKQYGNVETILNLNQLESKLLFDDPEEGDF